MSVSSDWMVVDLRRLLFAFGGLGLLVVIVTFAALGWGSVARLVEPDIERQLAERSASASFVIESMLQDAWTQARLLAVSPSVVAAAAQGARRAQQLGFDRLTPEQIELRIAANRSLRFRGDTDRFLRSVVDASVFGELFVTDRYGLVVATSAETSDFVQSEEEWWQAAFEGKDFLSEVERDESSGSIALSLSVPVRDASDQTVGVLKAVLDLRQIYPALERLSRGWGYVQVIDDRGLLLIDPHEKNLLTRVPNASSLTPGGLSRAQGEDGRTVVGIVRPAQFGVWSVVFWVPEEDAFALLSAARRAIAVGVGIALLISLVGVLGMGTWVSRAITRPINLVSAAADRVGGGDLRISVERLGSGEVAKLCLAVQRMVDRLRELVTSIRASSYHTQSRSQEIAGAVEQLSAGTEEMTATIGRLTGEAARHSETIREIHSGMETLGTAARELAEGAESATETSGALRGIAEANRERLQQGRAQVAQLTERSEVATARLLEFMEATRQFAEFVDVIQQFARRTDLLALNTAIEAARAGAEARGFAALAEEIRKLANQAGDAAGHAHQTTEAVLVQLESARAALEETMEATQEISSVVESMGEGFEQVDRATGETQQWAHRVAGVSAEVEANVKETTERLSAVSAVFSEFAAAMEEMAAGMQEQSATTQEIAAAVSALNSSAAQLAELAEVFIVHELPDGGKERKKGETQDRSPLHAATV
ncbi:MAG: methyl-accepting chemotaxis protein [Gemmatimonadota bacterium]